MPHFELLENLIYMILLSWGIILLIYHHGVVSRKKLVFIFIPNSDVESWINHPQVTAYNIYPWIPRGSFLVFISFVFISPLSITKKAYILVCLAWVLLKLFHHPVNMLSVLVYLTFLNWIIEVREERRKELIRCSNASFNRQTFMGIIGCCFSKYLYSSLNMTYLCNTIWISLVDVNIVLKEFRWAILI